MPNFLMALNQIVLQDTKKSFEHVYMDAKIYWFPPASPWDSTTVITLPLIDQSNGTVLSTNTNVWVTLLSTNDDYDDCRKNCCVSGITPNRQLNFWVKHLESLD